MVGPLAILNAIIAEIAANGPPAVQERMQLSSALFARFGVTWQPGDTEFEQDCSEGIEGSLVIAARDGGTPQKSRRPGKAKE
jgi:hypothetical protein